MMQRVGEVVHANIILKETYFDIFQQLNLLSSAPSTMEAVRCHGNIKKKMFSNKHPA
jgi:hypothetical protein